MSVSVLFQTILSNARLDRSKLDEKGHKVVKSPTAIAGRDQLNSAQFRVPVGYFSRPFSSSFDLSNLALDRTIWNKNGDRLKYQLSNGRLDKSKLDEKGREK